MLRNRSRWSELIAEHLRNPGKAVLFERSAKKVSVWEKEERRLQRLVPFLMPLRNVGSEAVREVYAPKMSNQQKFQNSPRFLL